MKNELDINAHVSLQVGGSGGPQARYTLSAGQPGAEELTFNITFCYGQTSSSSASIHYLTIQILYLLFFHLHFVFCHYVFMRLGWCMFIKWPAAYGQLAYRIDQCGSSSLCRYHTLSKLLHRSKDWCRLQLGWSYDNCQTGSQLRSFQGRRGDDTR